MGMPEEKARLPFLPIGTSRMSSAAKLTIGELEAGYPSYCKALRLLIRNGRSFEAIQRTVCWDRLSLLQRCLPSRYKSPDYLYALLKREVEQPAV